MEQDAIARAAAYLAEAFETGNPLAPLPPGLRPATVEDGAEIAGAALDALGLPPNGLRLAPGPGGAMLAGPMLATRIVASGTPVALSTLRHPRLSAAAIGVLAEPLDPASTVAPVIAALHPAIDIAASRYRDGARDAAECTADLGGLGLVVAGRRATWNGAPLPVALARDGASVRGTACDLAAAFARAAAEARRWGGLPAGALLVVAGLSPAATPAASEGWFVRFGRLGRAEARCLG